MVISGLSPRFCRLVENTYTNTLAQIKLGAKLGNPFTSNVGLRQGDPLSPLLFNLFIADLIFIFNTGCAPPKLQDLPVPSIQFADDICNLSTTLKGIRQTIQSTIQYCTANRLKVNISKSCYTVFNETTPITHPDILIHDQALKFDPKPCYLGLCLSNNKSDLSSVMIAKATRAAYGLRTMLDNTASANTINQLFSQLIEPILLYGAEQWLPYSHPRKIHQHGPKGTFTTPPPPPQPNSPSMERLNIYPLLPPLLHPNSGSQSGTGHLPHVLPHGQLPQPGSPLPLSTGPQIPMFQPLPRHRTRPPHRLCRFCDKQTLGDEYHAFTCAYFLDLQIYCSIHTTTRPQFISQMQDFPVNVQRYITLLMARIHHR